MNDAFAELKIVRLLQAPRSAVWRAWNEPEHFAKWWIPEPLRCHVVKMEMKAGGGFETRMSEDGGLTYQPHLERCFLEVVARERIVFTTCLTENWKPVDPWLALTTIVMMLDPGRCPMYTARAPHKNSEDSRKHREMGFEEGWGITIEQLSNVAATST
jgi:uncharacterized protein YndB with AHSA1/START domain